MDISVPWRIRTRENGTKEKSGVKRKVAGGEGNHGYIPEPGGDVGEGPGFDTEV